MVNRRIKEKEHNSTLILLITLKGEMDDILGHFALTAIDSLDTVGLLAISMPEKVFVVARNRISSDILYPSLYAILLSLALHYLVYSTLFSVSNHVR